MSARCASNVKKNSRAFGMKKQLLVPPIVILLLTASIATVALSATRPAAARKCLSALQAQPCRQDLTSI